MKASKAEAKKAQASLSQAESLADLSRKMSLVMAHLGVADVPDDPEADAAIDAAAAEMAGDPKEQKRLEAEAKKAAATPQAPTTAAQPAAPAPTPAADTRKADEKPVRKR